MIKRLIIATALFASLAVVSTQPALAAAPVNILGGGGACSSAPGSAVCTDTKKNPTGNPIAKEITKITDIVAWIAGAAAIIVIVVAGIRFITSNGDSNAVVSARNTIIYAAIGIVVIVAARSIIVFIVNRL